MTVLDTASSIDRNDGGIAPLVFRAEIRKAECKDLTRITEIVDCYAKDIYRHHDYEYLMKMRHFPETCLVAEIDDNVIGFLVGYRGGSANDTFFLWQVAIDEKYRGKELGLELIARACENAEQLGCRRLECTITNSASQRTFEKFATQRGSALVHIGEVSFRNRDTSLPEVEPLFEIDLAKGV